MDLSTHPEERGAVGLDKQTQEGVEWMDCF